MLTPIFEFLVMLNPFALFLYLQPIRNELSHRDFLFVLFKATLISFVVCLVFFLSGDLLFNKVFLIDFEAFRIFGGIIIFSYAYFFIVKGQKALIIIKENLDDLASEIALPFMVGAGAISLSIIMSQEQKITMGILSLLIIFASNFFFIFLLKTFRDAIEKRKFKTAFDKNMEVLLRVTGFFIGAIGINMVIAGISNYFNIA